MSHLWWNHMCWCKHVPYISKLMKVRAGSSTHHWIWDTSRNSFLALNTKNLLNLDHGSVSLCRQCVHAVTQQARLHFLTLYPHKNVHPCCGFTAAPGWFIWAVNKSTFRPRWWIICFDVSISVRQRHYNNTPPLCASHPLLDLRKNKWCWFATRCCCCCCCQQPSRDKIWLERGMLSYLVGLPAAFELQKNESWTSRFKEIIQEWITFLEVLCKIHFTNVF